MLACRLFGHRYRFAAEGPTMTWSCARCGHIGGRKNYPSAVEARQFATALNREDAADLGRRAPLLGMFPLRAAHALRKAGASRAKR